ncbi:hypothetical protein HDU81_008098 [Chytriomyces hyalinus]|nr:hypothetical protein HDU81_008098 [Chytriomyces hyalinus]
MHPTHQRAPQTPPPPPPPIATPAHLMTRKPLPTLPQSQQTDQCTLDVLTDPTKFYASVISLSITSGYNDAASEPIAQVPRSANPDSSTPPQQWQPIAMRRAASQSAPSKSHHHRAASESALLKSRSKLQQSPLASTNGAAVETSPIEPSVNFRSQKPNNFVSVAVVAAPAAGPSASKLQLHASSRASAPGPPSVSRSKSVLTSLRSMWQTGVNSAR